MTRVWYVEVVRMMVVIANLLLLVRHLSTGELVAVPCWRSNDERPKKSTQNLAHFQGSLASSSYDQYQNLDGKDARFWKKLAVMILLFCFFLLVIVLGLWGALVHSVVGLQSVWMLTEYIKFEYLKLPDLSSHFKLTIVLE